MSHETRGSGGAAEPIEGRLGAVPLIDVLSTLAARQSSGILTVQGERDIVAMSFLNGALVSTDALNQSVEEGLGDFLVAQNLVRPSDFSQILEEQRRTGARLVDLLSDRGLLERETVLNALRQMIYHSALRVLAWKKGDFKFYPADEVTFELGIEPIAVDEFLVRATRDLGREGPLAARLAEPLVVFERDGEETTGAGVQGSGPRTLSDDDMELLAKVDGERTVEELEEALDWSEHRLLYRLQDLERSGMIRRREPSEPEAEPEAEGEVGLPAAAPIPATEITAYSIPVDFEEPHAGLRESRVGVAFLVIATLVALILGLRLNPGDILLPFPWQAPQQARLSGVAVRATLLKVDSAAKTYYLLHGRFPANLGLLEKAGLLGSQDLSAPTGDELVFHASGESYELTTAGTSPGRPTSREAITGNFLLDPQFAGKSSQPQAPPLVLLD
ncbi:MAG TPA: DUF4388 domain-containing protein [Thermoanaerobaculia bacterium]|nr:DUF4388 domain-containing protein [Thermoanaerobaculia bacterium]